MVRPHRDLGPPPQCLTVSRTKERLKALVFKRIVQSDSISNDDSTPNISLEAASS